MKQVPEVDQVLNARSTWDVTMQRYMLTGPISPETYPISNDNGATSMFYSATNRDGTLTKQFNVPLSGPSATFLYEQLRSDGIWELAGKPIRPKPKEESAVEVSQPLGNQGGSRAL